MMPARIKPILNRVWAFLLNRFYIHSRYQANIFLRMIKTIIAPLLFATLVYGIAGHSNLKEVGRMGLKSIVYFEVVTTIALFIGLAAINLSGAGFGVQLQAQDAQMKSQQTAFSKARTRCNTRHISREHCQINR
jgi:Na+/H+-dicarboxylate symporter